MNWTIDRRGFLAGTAALGVSTAAHASKLRPTDRVNLAVIGAGGMGAYNMARLTDHNIVAAVDVDFDHVRRGMVDGQGATQSQFVALRAAYDKATRYGDYRRFFDQQRGIDAVLIATPDHHHAIAARMAMERGLHVYVQKPLTRTVAEARHLAALARAKPGLVTQMGNQGHSGDDGRRVVELIRGGAIGKVREVHAWTNRPVWPQGIARPAAVAAPASLDWGVWLGPANVGWGYHPDYAHFNWRGWRPFGTGALGDMGAHLLDFPVWALELGQPTRIEVSNTLWGGDTDYWDDKPPAALDSYPLAMIARFTFGNAPGGALPLTWYDGGLKPPLPEGLPAGTRLNGVGGVLYIGDKGKLMHETYGEKPVLIGEGVAERAAAIPLTLPRIPKGRDGHELNWIAAIRGDTIAASPFPQAAALTETMLLGIIALEANQPIEFDAGTGRIINMAGGDDLLTRTYRDGWSL